MTTTRQAPNYGTYALLVAVAGLGGWTLHQALDDGPSASLVSAGQAADRSALEGRLPIKLTIVNGTPPNKSRPGQPKRTVRIPRHAPGAFASQPGMVTAPLLPTPRPFPPVGHHDGHQPARAGQGDASPGTHAIFAGVVDEPADTAEETQSEPADEAPSVLVWSGDSYQVLATQGAIVYIGENGQLIGNTGATSSSGVVALGVDGSTLQTGESSGGAGQLLSGDSPAAGGSLTAVAAVPSHANSSFTSLSNWGGAAGTSVALSGFEDHSVSVIGNDQIVTYDDSNVFIDREGLINANTGDTDSSGLNAVDVVGSYVASGNSGDGEGDEGDDDEAEEAEEESASELPAAAAEGASVDESESTESSDDEDENGDDEADEDTGLPSGYPAPGTSYATVTDEGASMASGEHAFVVGADGYDDVSIRSYGDRNIVTYDDSNVVIGGSGTVNAQIGDSDTGGAVVMGIHNSHVQAGCEGDLCYSD